jgi:hypothetical protein
MAAFLLGKLGIRIIELGCVLGKLGIKIRWLRSCLAAFLLGCVLGKLGIRIMKYRNINV